MDGEPASPASFLARVAAAAELLITPGAKPETLAAALGGHVDGAGPRCKVIAPGSCLQSASLFVPGTGTASVTLVPDPGAAPDRAALEAALGPAEELVPRPGQSGTQTLSFDYPSPERYAAINADFPRHPAAEGPARVTALTIIRQRTRPAPVAPTSKRGLFSWLRR
jgi:hypothetical protein